MMTSHSITSHCLHLVMFFLSGAQMKVLKCLQLLGNLRQPDEQVH